MDKWDDIESANGVRVLAVFERERTAILAISQWRYENYERHSRRAE